MKLKPMTDFVLELQDNELMSKIGILAINYANFLKTPLKLEMFVPEKPEPTVDAYMKPKEMTRQYDEWFKKYGQNVLFEDFEIALNKENERVILGDYTCLKVSDLENGTIEDLIKYVHIKLSKSAVKRIFG